MQSIGSSVHADDILGGLDPAFNDIDALRKARQLLLDQLSRPAEKNPCGCSNKRGRNLIVCIDGTSNQFGEKVRTLSHVCTLEVEDDIQLRIV